MSIPLVFLSMDTRIRGTMIAIKTSEEVKATVVEWQRIDRGFLTARLMLIVVVIALAAAVLSSRLILVVAVVVLAADFAVFCRRRILTLRRYEAGAPRLITAEDFAAVSESFRQAGIAEPSMTDWETAAGHSGHAAWRVALRYQELLKHYTGGTVADVGCGDGRLCWHYGICKPEDYIGLDVGEDLLRQLRDKTSNKARTVVATAEVTTLADASVDFVACTEVFEHLPHPEIAVQEFSRILRPGGKVVIQSPNATQLRNLNPLHAICCVVGIIFPSLLMRKVVHENTFVHAFTYHWDFTRQDIRSYLKNSGLFLRSLTAATYRFNPQGSVAHRIAYKIARLPFISWAWGDMTVVLEKIT
jgi:ubiquinone/menaquinone biosynthesis C-methylase UbiE